MRNNAAYLPENPIVYIIFPESIHNRASFCIFENGFGRLRSSVSPGFEKMEKLDAHSADFRQFFLVHYETLCIRAFRLVHDRNLSEDIVQDVFLMLWKRRTEIDFSRPVLPYLTTAVRNRSIDCLRSRKSRGEGTCGLDTLDGYVRCLVADRCEEEFDLSWLRHEIDDGVSQLSEQCRRVFLLSRVTGLKNREIAERLNISVKAVEKHIGVALSKLRLRLSRSGFFNLFL